MPTFRPVKRRHSVAVLVLLVGAVGIAWVLHRTEPLVLLAPATATAALCLRYWRGAIGSASTGAAALGCLLAGDGYAAPWFALGVGLSFVVADNARLRLSHARLRARQATERLEHASVVDIPTRCVNRRGLDLVAPPLLFQSRRRGDAVYCAAVQIDGLRRVTSEHGFEAAEQLVAGIAEALRASTRAADVVARTDLGVFHVVGPGRGVTAPELERRCRMFLLDQPAIASAVWSGGLFVGAAVLAPWEDGDLDSLMARADAELDIRVSSGQVFPCALGASRPFDLGSGSRV